MPVRYRRAALSLLALTLAHLARRRIPHALIGAGAMALRGVSRATLDLDLLVTDRACLKDETWDALRVAGVAVAVRKGDADDPLAGVIRLDLAGAEPVDVVVGRSAWQERVLARARRHVVHGVRIPVATAADLILLKLYAGGVQDRWDIQQLLAGSDHERIGAAVVRELDRLPRRCRRLWGELVSARTA